MAQQTDLQDWLDDVYIMDFDEFSKAVQRRTISVQGTATATGSDIGELVPTRIAAELLDSTIIFVGRLEKAGILKRYGSGQAMFRRDEIAAFAQQNIMAREIIKRFDLVTAGQIRRFLAKQGVDPSIEVPGFLDLIYDRREVEQVSYRRAA